MIDKGRTTKENTRPFMGWRVLLAATIGLGLGFSNIGVALFGLFIIPLSEAFGWGRGDMSIAVLLMNYTLVLFAPILGYMLDRYGVRKVLLPSTLLFAFVIFALGSIKGSIYHFYLLYILLTLLGLGTIPASYTQVVIAWFDRRRGIAIGVAMAGVGLGAALLPPYVQYLIGSFGWRFGYYGLSLLIIFVSFPVCYFLLIEHPKDVGQIPDGNKTKEDFQPTGIDGTSLGYCFRDCLSKRVFWLMVAGFTLLGFSTSGVLVHLVPLLQDRGVSPGLAAIGASFLGISLIFGRIACGLLLDLYHAPKVVVVFLLGPLIGFVMMASGFSHIWAFIAIMLIGLGVGAELDFMSYLVSRYLGTLAYGQAYGWMYASFALGAGLGPLLMGYVQENYGTYDLALWVLSLATAMAILPFSRLGAYPDLMMSTAKD